MSPQIGPCEICGTIKQVGVPCEVCKERARWTDREKERRTELYNRHKGQVHNEHKKPEDR